MLIGNRHEIAASLFAPGYTMAAVIANEFSEAADRHALLGASRYVALVLFAANDRRRTRGAAARSGGSRAGSAIGSKAAMNRRALRRVDQQFHGRAHGRCGGPGRAAAAVHSAST